MLPSLEKIRSMKTGSAMPGELKVPRLSYFRFRIIAPSIMGSI